jgi:hypothetical protein
VNPDGTGLTSLGAIGYRAVWSPDGTRVAYQTYPEGAASPPAATSHIYTRNADGSNPQLVSANSYRDHAPDWQPIPSGYPRPRGASPVYASLVPAYTACASPNRTHGAPLSFGSCASPAPASPNLTVGTPDANGNAAGFVGSVVLAVHPGKPATLADEADVRVNAQLSDIRNAGDLSDYTGELELLLPVRITDRDSTGAGPATVQSSVLSAAVPCAATAGAAGGICSAATTVEAIIPGAVKEGVRSIWELSQLRVNDGGADDEAGTPDNALFAVQGVFAP